MYEERIKIFIVIINDSKLQKIASRDFMKPHAHKVWKWVDSGKRLLLAGKRKTRRVRKFCGINRCLY